MDHQNHERWRKKRKTFARVTIAKRITKRTAAPKDGVYENRPSLANC
jgi:hypothetical protein